MTITRLRGASLVTTAVVLSFVLSVPAASAQSPPSLRDAAARSVAPPAPLPAERARAAGRRSEEPAASPFLAGRFLVGATFGHAYTAEDDLGSEFKYSPFFRFTPKRGGWGPSFSLNWFSGHVREPVGGSSLHLGTIRFRPLMAGAGYTFFGRAATTVAVVAGWSFNSVAIDARLPPGVSATIDVRNGWAVRPNVTTVYPLTRRLALLASVGYVVSDPEITVRVERAGQPPQVFADPYHSHYVNVTIGTAVAIF